MIKMYYQKKTNSLIWFVSIFIFANFLFAQETHNLEIIWERGTPGDTLFFTYGSELSSGDFNGDGYSDIVVNGDSWVDPLQGICIFKAYIFFGGPQFDTIPDVVIASDTTWGFLRVKGIGDINGDGFDDIALGSPHYEKVYIFLGGNPMDTICDFLLKGPGPGANFGQAIGSGDVNGDRNRDLIIGAYGAAPMPGGADMGLVFIYFGGLNFDTIPDVILKGGHENDYEGFGTSVSGAGDVNKDGFSDLIIGAGNFGPWIQGRVYVYLGGNSIDTIYDVAISGHRSWQQLGLTGVDFLINPTKDNAIIGGYGLEKQEVCVLFGGSEMDSIPDVLLTTEGDSSYLSSEAVNAGFTRCNEASDALAGAPTEYGREGSAYLWLGGEFLDSLPDAWIRGTQSYDEIGWQVASAGDVNGDGKDEIMVSNYGADETSQKVWVCKYTGQGIEESRRPPTANRIPLKIEPNPAKSQTAIRFSLSVISKVSLMVYDITGKLVKTIEDCHNKFEPGNYDTRWNLRDNNQKRVSAGIYFIEIKTDDKASEIRKIMVVK
jgi:hypothetical protein